MELKTFKRELRCEILASSTFIYKLTEKKFKMRKVEFTALLLFFQFQSFIEQNFAFFCIMTSEFWGGRVTFVWFCGDQIINCKFAGHVVRLERGLLKNPYGKERIVFKFESAINESHGLTFSLVKRFTKSLLVVISTTNRFLLTLTSRT